MQPGVNNITAAGSLTIPSQTEEPEKYKAVMTFLSRFVSNFFNNVTLHGLSDSSPYNVLNPAFSALNVSAAFPGLGGNLVQSGTQYPTPDGLFGNSGFVNSSLRVYNPLSTQIEIVDGALVVYVVLGQ